MSAYALSNRETGPERKEHETTVRSSPGTPDDQLKETAFGRDGVKKFTDGHEVVKVIIVKDKLVNIVVK